MPLKVLIVDDDGDFRAMTTSGLSELFEVKQADSGAHALQLTTEFTPHIALIDVNMPDMNGYQVCQALKAAAPDIRVLFVSGDNTFDARVAAHDAGADDFIPKPFRLAELKLKMATLERTIKDSHRLIEQVKSATDVAKLALSSSGEMGGVVDFIKRASACKDSESLLKVLVTASASTFQLSTSAQIRYNDEQKTLNSEGRSSPIEGEVMRSYSKDSQHIFSVGRRLVINYPRVTLQVKNMPNDDPDRCGRLRDHLAIVVEAAEKRLDGMTLERQAHLRHATTLTAVASIQQVMVELEADYRRQGGISQTLLDDLKTDVEYALMSLGLTDAQEQSLMKIIAKNADKAAAVYSQGLALDEKFQTILTALQQLQFAEPPAPATPPDDFSDDSIILF